MSTSTTTAPAKWAGPTRRTPDEIVAQIEAWEDDDWMGTKRGDLIEHLPYSHAKPFLQDGVTENEWEEQRRSGPDPWERAEDYLDFAAGKIEDERGLSAGRSVDHFIAWSWLLDPTGEATRQIEAAPYGWYGENQVATFARLFEMRWPRMQGGAA